jgi:hypothetical protein
MKFKAILLIHRYLGFVLSLLFVIWFLSGFVMMYAGYPTMKYEQRLQQLPVVPSGKFIPPPDSASSIRLGTLLNRPVYRVNQQQVVFADNGALLTKVDTALARRIAQAFVHDRTHPVAIDELHEIDQWMAAHRSQGYAPDVYRCTMEDDSYVYVSMHTAEVVQMVTAKQRLLAWLGPIPHWLYPTILIRNRPVWSQVVIWVSLVGTIMCLTGIIMGIVRYKRKRGVKFSPYKKVWFKYHHYTGFIFGLFVFTWILSGLFSMSPIPLSHVKKGKQAGSELLPATFLYPPIGFTNPKEIHLIQVAGQPYYLAYEDSNRTQLLQANIPGAKPFDCFDKSVFSSKGDVLHSYDNYYYSRKYEKQLPVLRIKEGDTWTYINLRTGQVALKLDKGARIERWLYHGLHSLDFKFLVYKRPLWDIVVWILMLGGTMVSITGLALTYKWLKRKLP